MVVNRPKFVLSPNETENQMIDPKFVAELHKKVDAAIVAAEIGTIQVINATRTVNDYMARL